MHLKQANETRKRERIESNVGHAPKANKKSFFEPFASAELTKVSIEWKIERQTTVSSQRVSLMMSQTLKSFHLKKFRVDGKFL